MIVTKETKRLLSERRAVKADKDFGQQAFTLFYRDYVFAGSIRPTGVKYCLRTSDGACRLHGIVFGPLKNALAELPAPLPEWDIPTVWSEKPIRALGTCNRTEENLFDRILIPGLDDRDENDSRQS